MLGTENLSLEQAPPISIPMRFFLTAPLFGVAAAMLLLWQGPEMLLSRWSPPTLAMTHLLVLGFLALTMCGALLQMLPVLAGVPVPRVVLVGGLSHLLMVLGTMSLVFGLILLSSPWLKSAVVILGIGFSVYILAVMIALWRVRVPNITVTGMRMALLALLVTLLLGVMLASGLAGWVNLGPPQLYTNTHLVWGILGWVGLLVVGVSFQVVPMFQVTPEYPRWMGSWLPRALLVGLSIWTMLYVTEVRDRIAGGWSVVWLSILLLGYIWFAVTTLRLQRQRRRKIPDVTLMFWRIGIGAIPICFLVWMLGRLVPAMTAMAEIDLLLGVGMILGAAIALMNGMLYKIVPFLSWFHLQNRQLATMCLSVQVPNMKQLLPDHVARRQFWVYVLALVCTLVAIFLPAWFARPAGMLWAISFTLLGLNLLRVMVRYREVDQELTEANQAAR